MLSLLFGASSLPCTFIHPDWPCKRSYQSARQPTLSAHIPLSPFQSTFPLPWGGGPRASILQATPILPILHATKPRPTPKGPQNCWPWAEKAALSELTWIFSWMDKIFPTAFLKRNFKDWGLGFRAELVGLGLGLGLKFCFVGWIWYWKFRV